MSFLIDIAFEVLVAIFGWRTWLSFLAGLVAAYFLDGYDLFVIWPDDLSVFAVILGLGLGIIWEGTTNSPLHQFQ